MRKPQEAYIRNSRRTALNRKLIDRSLGTTASTRRQARLPALGAQGCWVFPNKQLSEHDGHCMPPVRRAFPPPRHGSDLPWPLAGEQERLQAKVEGWPQQGDLGVGENARPVLGRGRRCLDRRLHRASRTVATASKSVALSCRCDASATQTGCASS